jgi:hypothetical protein
VEEISKIYMEKLVGDNGFLTVNHDTLNNPNIDFEKVFEDSNSLESNLNGKTVVSCCEGDLLQTSDTDEPIFTHASISAPNQYQFEQLRDAGKAAYFTEILEKYLRFKSDHPDQRMVLCIELKMPTKKRIISETNVKLISNHLSHKDVYYDSFFANKLDHLIPIFPKSLHLMANIGNVDFCVNKSRFGYNFVTVPEKTSFGKYSTSPVIYGAVGSLERLQRCADEENCIGAYTRFKEGSALKMFAKSIKR